MTALADVFPLIEIPEDSRFVVELITVPLFTGVIGYVTNWSGVLMLFSPVGFHGVRVPGLKLLWPFLPRRMQVIPAITKDGRFGWQGIVPSRADKMASIATDKALLKVGSMGDFYREFDPDKIAEHLAKTARSEIRGIVSRIMEAEHPQLWRDLPPSLKEAVFERVDAQLPEIVRGITHELGEHIDQCIDAKLLIMRHFRQDPALMNSIFLEMGGKELRFMKNSGFYFGIPAGLILVGILHYYPFWWVLPVGGVVIGYVVNYIAVWAVFEPIEPKRIGPFKLHGLFLKRQAEAGACFADIISRKIITIENIGDELMHGPRSDRTQQMLQTVLEPAADKAIGPAKGAVRVAVGTREYDRIRASLANEVTGFSDAFADADFNLEMADRISKFVGEQMVTLSPHDFAELLRSAIHDDEWLLFLHGALLGLFAGLIHLGIFGV
ncbi:MAG: hypothetical protein ACRDZU_13455 [Acidimicrobiales bacterium]